MAMMAVALVNPAGLVIRIYAITKIEINLSTTLKKKQKLIKKLWEDILMGKIP